jgi:hypothetical protein
VAVRIVARPEAVPTNKKKSCVHHDEQALQDCARDELSSPYFDADRSRLMPGD